jgi:3-hydroxy-3-methylglutaryl CoA synthase
VRVKDIIPTISFVSVQSNFDRIAVTSNYTTFDHTRACHALTQEFGLVCLFIESSCSTLTIAVEAELLNKHKMAPSHTLHLLFGSVQSSTSNEKFGSLPERW